MKLDHLVIGAANIGEGVAWMKDQTGLDLPPGGEHVMMSTHNHLTRLTAAGQVDAAYFEVIAPNPDMQRPDHARWFSFDDPAHLASLHMSPKPVAWVVAVDDLAGLLTGLPEELSAILGRPVQMHRGDLTWKFCLREDGLLPDGGLLPVLIEWPGGIGPADKIMDQGLAVTAITLDHPAPDALKESLQAIGCLEPLARLLTIREGAHKLDFDLSVQG